VYQDNPVRYVKGEGPEAWRTDLDEQGGDRFHAPAEIGKPFRDQVTTGQCGELV